MGWAELILAAGAALQDPDALRFGDLANGQLRVPAREGGAVPAVVIVTSTNGFDGRSRFYAERLNAAGIATLELDTAGGRGLPATPRTTVAIVYATLERLAADPRIDGERIGLMGFSWGGALTLLASSELLAAEQSTPRRFAAHLALYPICWRHLEIAQGRSKARKDLGAPVYRRLTGRPVHILVGARDGYDGPDTCGRFVGALPAAARAHVGLTVYEGATFAWDSRFSSAPWEAGANGGRGGIVPVEADAALAERSRAFALRFFERHLRRE